MSVYEYERSGRIVTREFRIGRAPRSIRVKGKRFNRRICMPVIHNAGNVDGKDAQFVGYSLGDEFNKYHQGDFKVGPSGKTKYPCFSSKRQREEFETRVNADHHVHGRKIGFERVAGPNSTSCARGSPED